MNKAYLGASFQVVGLRLPKPYVIFLVPVAIRDDGTLSTITQHLGYIKRKNDKRYVAFRKPNKTFFMDYPKEKVFEKVFPTIEEAQQFILDGIPDGIDRSHIQFLNKDDVEKVK